MLLFAVPLFPVLTVFLFSRFLSFDHLFLSFSIAGMQINIICGHNQSFGFHFFFLPCPLLVFVFHVSFFFVLIYLTFFCLIEFLVSFPSICLCEFCPFLLLLLNSSSLEFDQVSAPEHGLLGWGIAQQ